MKHTELPSAFHQVGLSVLRLLLLGLVGVMGLMLPVGTCLAEDSGAPPWRVAPTVAVSEREIRFANGGASLVGTLFLPKGESKYPVVVVTHAAASPTRNFALLRHNADQLPLLGYGVFIYDRRGSGASTGDRQTADFPLLADDAIAAARAVAADAHVDARRIGYWGLSQGGWLAVLAATRDPRAAFAISVSAPLTTPAEQMHFAIDNLLSLRGYSKADRDAHTRTRRLLDDYYIHAKVNQVTAQRGVDLVVHRPWFKDAYLPPDVGSNPEQSRWRKELAYDPVAPLQAAKVPVLLVFGGADPWIGVRESLERLPSIIGSRRNVSVRLIAGANHGMQIVEQETMVVDEASIVRMAPSAPDYFLALGAWLGGLGFAPPQ